VTTSTVGPDGFDPSLIVSQVLVAMIALLSAFIASRVASDCFQQISGELTVC